jgi:flagellar biogenesis protein FliO
MFYMKNMSENLKNDNRTSWTDTLMTVIGLVVFVLFVVYVFERMQQGMMVLP